MPPRARKQTRTAGQKGQRDIIQEKKSRSKIESQKEQKRYQQADSGHKLLLALLLLLLIGLGGRNRLFVLL